MTAGQPWNGPATVNGAGSTYSFPMASVNGSTGLITLWAQGANNTFENYWVYAGQPWNGPLTIGGPGTTFF